MSIEQVIRFMEKAAVDEALQAQVKKIMAVEGISENCSLGEEGQLGTHLAAVLQGEPGDAVVSLAAKNNFDFSRSELIQVLDLFAKYHSAAISDAEFIEFMISANLHQDTKDHLFFAEEAIEKLFF